MKFIQVSIVFLFTIYCCQAVDVINIGDGVETPQVFISATNENNILTITTGSTIIRGCDRFLQKVVTTSVRGIMTDMKTSCVHGRICGFPGNSKSPGPPVDIDCNVYLRNL